MGHSQSVGILDNAGTLVVEYKYDTWGKPLSTTGILADTLGKRNSFRYRGYVYDEEMELYYLRSRYYNSQSGRFVNADAYITTGCGINNGNPFIYCNNTPASLIDPDGTRFWSTVKALVSAAYAIVRSIIGYDSAEAAAKAFFQCTYSQSRYIRHEYGT